MTGTFIQKVCLLGRPAVGKTQVVERFVHNAFDGHYIQTIGINIVSRREALRFKKQDYVITDLIWDINGKFLDSQPNLLRTYLQGTSGVIVMYDATNRATVAELTATLRQLKEFWREVPVVFLANKVDLEDTVRLEERVLSGIASEWDADYFYTSAKTGKNIPAAFTALNKAIIARGCI